MIHKVLKEEAIWDWYELKITFDRWEVRKIDLSKYILNSNSFIFWPLKNKYNFKLFTVKDDTLVWETLADFCPNVLYKNSKAI